MLSIRSWFYFESPCFGFIVSGAVSLSQVGVAFNVLDLNVVHTHTHTHTRAHKHTRAHTHTRQSLINRPIYFLIIKSAHVFICQYYLKWWHHYWNVCVMTSVVVDNVLVIHQLADIISLIQSTYADTLVNMPGTSAGLSAVLKDAIPYCTHLLCRRQTSGPPLSPWQRRTNTVKDSSSIMLSSSTSRPGHVNIILITL